MNQNPEQLAIDGIDRQLIACGWAIQNKNSFNLAAGVGVVLRNYQNKGSSADYILFVYQKTDWFFRSEIN